MACFRPFGGISNISHKISGFPVRISDLERIYNKTGSEISNPICQTFKIPGTSAVLIRWCINACISFMACSCTLYSNVVESATNRSISLYRCSNSARLIVCRRAPVLVSSIIISVSKMVPGLSPRFPVNCYQSAF